jgi:hypothetical protein
MVVRVVRFRGTWFAVSIILLSPCVQVQVYIPPLNRLPPLLPAFCRACPVRFHAALDVNMTALLYAFLSAF